MSDASALRVHRSSHRAMACDWELWIAHADVGYAEQAAREAWREVDRIENELSRFRDGSDIARLNAEPVGQALRIGPDAAACLSTALRLCAETGGAFDCAVGARVPRRRPDGSIEPASEDAPIGMRHLRIDERARTVTRLAEGVCVDLGAIGKGYAIDRAVELLRKWGVAAALLTSGQSTVYALGVSPGGGAWRVAVRDPCDHARALGAVSLRDEAFSGSGLALHGAHIIDPRSGRPAERNLAAWAIAPTAAESDAVSTAFMVMSREEFDAYCIAHPAIVGLLLPRGANAPICSRPERVQLDPH